MSDRQFPKGVWFLCIIDSDGQSVPIGDLNLVELLGSSGHYVGAMKFNSDEKTMGTLAGLPFPVKLISYDSENGKIVFQIQGAASIFKPDTNAPYRFYFEGNYDPLTPPFLSGMAKVPMGFGCESGDVGEDGQNLGWMSAGPYPDSSKDPS